MGKCLISNNVRKLRFNHNEMTQQQLAEKVGVTRQTIVAIEKGKYSPSLELAFRIALVFNLPLEEVFFIENKEELSMKAIVCTKYGTPEVLQLKEVEKPTPKDNEVRIRVHAAIVTPSDCAFRKADPFIVRFIYGLRDPNIRY